MGSQRDNDPVAEYLDRLRAALSMLPKSEREQVYRELAQHVEAMVEEAIRAGDDSDNAIRDALRKFGDPEKIGQRVVTDYWRRNTNFYRAPFQLRSLVIHARESSFGAVLAGASLTVWLQILAMATAYLLDVSPAIWIVLGAISGTPLGLACGWNWAKGRAQSFARVPKKPWQRWTREHMGFVVITITVALILAIVFVMESHLALHDKRSLVMNTAMVVAELVIASLSQRFFFPGLKKVQSK